MEERVRAPLRVFLVEDSAMLRTRVEAMLHSIAGAQVIGHAEDAESAIRAILAGVPDVVVLDLQLAAEKDGKASSGLDVLRALHKAAPQIRVYVLTNFAMEGYRLAAERLGARGFFDKTNEFERLREALVSSAPSG